MPSSMKIGIRPETGQVVPIAKDLKNPTAVELVAGKLAILWKGTELGTLRVNRHDRKFLLEITDRLSEIEQKDPEAFSQIHKQTAKLLFLRRKKQLSDDELALLKRDPLGIAMTKAREELAKKGTD